MASGQKHKSKKFSITLSEKEVLMLNQYASCEGVTRPVALKRLLRERLREVAAVPPQQQDEAQLCLFDSVQVDIFNNFLKVK